MRDRELNTVGSPTTAERTVGYVVCGLEQDFCICVLPSGHDEAHACNPHTCGGSWTLDKSGAFRVVTLPGIATYQ